MGRVNGKVAIVTGGGSGIGEATCQLLAAEGAEVVVTDIDQSAAEKTVLSITNKGDRAIALQHDVANESSWQEVIDAVIKTYSSLHILVNNAGTGLAGECKETPLKDWRHVMDVNLDGVFLGVRSAINMMLAMDKPSSIINVSSAYGLVGGGVASYCASKGGVTLLTKAVAAECGAMGYNIRVNSVHPGAVDTPMSHLDPDESKNMKVIEEFSRKIPLGRYAKPIEIANGILFLASDESSFMTGSELVMDGGYTAV